MEEDKINNTEEKQTPEERQLFGIPFPYVRSAILGYAIGLILTGLLGYFKVLDVEDSGSYISIISAVLGLGIYSFYRLVLKKKK